jgi:anti-anti-sigma factor
MAQLNVETTKERSATVITLIGEVDLATAPDLERRLATAVASGDTVTDLSGVDFMDSTGLRVLISAHEAAGAAGHRLALIVPPSGPVSKLLSITGVDRELPVFGSVSEALDAVDG